MNESQNRGLGDIGIVRMVAARRSSACVAALLAALTAATGASAHMFGGFAPHQEFAVGSSPESVVIGDFNGDGIPDLAVANRNSNSASVLINQTDVLPPGGFDLNLPPDGVIGLPLPELLASWPGGGAGTAPVSWSRATGFQNLYRLRIALDEAFTAVVFEQTTPGLKINLPDGVLEMGRTYHWTVIAENPVGPTTAASGSFTFSMRNPADVNGDGVVNGLDLLLLLNNWSSVK